MPDNVYKSGDVKDEGSGITIQNLGPEEEFANNVLKSLKEKIADARERIQELEDEIEDKKQQAEAQREEILEEARNEAQQIRQEAEDEAQQLIESKQEEVEDSRQEGYDDGFEEGKHDAREEMAELIEQAETILHEAKREREAFLDRNTESLVNLSGTIAKEIVRDYLEIDTDTIKRVVKDALDELSEVNEVTVVLNPEDAKIVESVKEDFRENHPNLTEITITSDPKMDRGGCRIRTEFGDVQGSVQDQIEHLTDTLIEDLEAGDTDALSDSTNDESTDQ